jgi:uncharacterized protein (TIGR00730 family)
VSARRVCVYCASSRSCHPDYHRAAGELGRTLATHGYTVVYGGGGFGSMGALADGALAAGGHVLGVIPDFMRELEWGHPGLSELRVVEDMRARKHLMLEGADAVVALPGGSGTLEELFEAISLKRLGIWLGPIVLVNTRGFFDAWASLMRRAIDERFMDERHAAMWTVVDEPARVPEAIRSSAAWSHEARGFAAV